MLDPQTAPILIALLAAVAIAGAVFVLAWPYLSGEKQAEKRIQNVTEARAKKLATRTAVDNTSNRRQAVADSLKEIEQRQRKQKVSLRLRLQQAGLDMTPKAFWFASAACGAILAVAVYFSLPPSSLSQIAVVIAAFVGVFGLPRWLLGKMIKRRQQKFVGELANAIDVVVRGVKSGLPLNECLGIISRESPDPVSTEFREIVEQQRVGVTMAEALDKLIERMPLPEVKFLAIVIAIQQQAGGNLSEALGNLSSVLRDRFRMSMKVKALSAEAKASAMVLGSLPPMVMLMVYGAAPDYIMPLFATKSGNLLLTLGGLWMLMGVLVMRKMINFKY